MKKVRVFAACALGGSISFFAKKMIEAAKEYDIDLEVVDQTVDEAYSFDLNEFDVILVAPQVRWHTERLKKAFPQKPVVAIDGKTYALLDGERGFKELVWPYIKDKL
jgi:cellobiose-specific phosphotransferase system component IIB